MTAPARRPVPSGVAALGRPWDMFAAEFSDTQRGDKSARQKLPCVYCGHPTKALSRVCLAHSDLPKYDNYGQSKF